MNCPLEITEKFSDWSNTCQECRRYQECMNQSYENVSEDKEVSGDNFPTYHIIDVRKMIKKDRTEMIEKLLIENLGKITQDDVDDIEIDIGIYNQKCRKEKIKRQYKKKVKQDE
jgi:hypothetical protein